VLVNGHTPKKKMRLIKLQFVRSQQILLGQIPSAPSTYMRQVNHTYHLVSPPGIPESCMIKAGHIRSLSPLFLLGWKLIFCWLIFRIRERRGTLTTNNLLIVSVF